MLKQVEDNIATYVIDLAAEQKKSAMFANTLYISTAVVLCGICIALGFLIMRGINWQVRELVDTLQYCSANNALDKSLVVKGKDEFSHISGALNQVFETFKAAIQNITSSSETLASSSEQNTVTVAQTSAALNDQKEQTYLVATAIEEMSQTINEVSNNTQETAQAAAQAEQLIAQSEAVVN
ncbi:hypothetical protein [Colwellia sp. MEBiC06753]